MPSINKDQSTPQRPEADPGTPASEDRSIIESGDLIGRDGTIRILHSGEIYTLRVTRNNRLILTK